MHQSQENQRASRFVTENTSLLQQASYRCPPKTLLARFFLRNAVSFLLGISAGVAVNGLEEKEGVSEHLGDVASCATTLIMTYVMDWLLEKCWPVNPYSPGQSIFSKHSTNNINTNISVDTSRCEIR